MASATCSITSCPPSKRCSPALQATYPDQAKVTGNTSPIQDFGHCWGRMGRQASCTASLCMGCQECLPDVARQSQVRAARPYIRSAHPSSSWPGCGKQPEMHGLPWAGLIAPECLQAASHPRSLFPVRAQATMLSCCMFVIRHNVKVQTDKHPLTDRTLPKCLPKTVHTSQATTTTASVRGNAAVIAVNCVNAHRC